jgi:hypothetical protein
VAFGTRRGIGSSSRGKTASEPPVLFCSTDGDRAGENVERLIRTAGFELVKVGGVEQSGRHEVGEGLHDLIVGPAEGTGIDRWGLMASPGRGPPPEDPRPPDMAISPVNSAPERPKLRARIAISNCYLVTATLR